jgi:hypothetical protein
MKIVLELDHHAGTHLCGLNRHKKLLILWIKDGAS